MRKNWTIRLATFALWLLAAGSAVFWALKFVQGAAAPAHAATVAVQPVAQADSAALARGLGGGATNNIAAGAISTGTNPLNASKFVLTGIVAGPSVQQGIALIAIDGKPARPYRVGALVADGLVLKSVQARQAELASSTSAATAVTLDLPQPSSAVVGSALPVFNAVAAVPVPAPAAMVVKPPVVVPANPVAALGQNPVRPPAIRSRAGREAGKDPAQANPASPAGAATP